MNFGQAIKNGFVNYANFKGRASRSEYWYWVLFTVLVGMVLDILFTQNTMASYSDSNPVANLQQVTNVPQSIWNLVTLVPSWALMVRRLRDAGYSPKRLWLSAIPLGIALLGAIALIGNVLSTPNFASGTYHQLANMLILPLLILGLAAVAGLVITILFIVWLSKPTIPADPEPIESDYAGTLGG